MCTRDTNQLQRSTVVVNSNGQGSYNNGSPFSDTARSESDSPFIKQINRQKP